MLHVLTTDFLEPGREFLRRGRRELRVAELLEQAADDFADYLHILRVVVARHRVAPRDSVVYKDALLRFVVV